MLQSEIYATSKTARGAPVGRLEWAHLSAYRLRACESFRVKPCDLSVAAFRHERSRFCEIAQNELLSRGLHVRGISSSQRCLTATSVFADKRAACWSKGRHHEGAPDSAKRARCPRVDRHSPLPGDFGHHVRRHDDRCAGCFRWTGTGKSG
jgi:hypothetical protein